MTQCVDITSEGFIKVSDKNLEDCTSFILVSSSEYTPVDQLNLNAIHATQAFTFGFLAVFIFGYFSTYALGIAKRLIRMI